MLPNPLLRKLVQISEEALPPIHGNDAYILTQQDVRKTEDSRFFMLSKILPNGGLKIINSLEAANCLQQLSQREDSQYQQLFVNFLEFLNYKSNGSSQAYQQARTPPPQQNFAFNDASYPQPMEVTITANNVSSISQQLEWNKCTNTSAPFPLHYSHGTSTTEIDGKNKMNDRISKSCKCCQKCSNCKNPLTYADKSTYMVQFDNKIPNDEALDAREQLKRKKICCFSP